MNPRVAPVTLTLAKYLVALAALCTGACSGSEQPAAAGGAAGAAGTSGGTANGNAANGGAAAGGVAAGGTATAGTTAGGSETGGTDAGGAGIADAGEAGSAENWDDAGDAALISPANLLVTPRPGINSAFTVIALTLRPGSDGLELLAAVRNDSAGVLCNASFAVDLHDEDDQVVASNVNGLRMRRNYRFNDGSGIELSCAAPGDLTMVEIPSLVLDPPTTKVKSVVYSSTYWGNLDIAPITGVSLSGVESTTHGTGLAYSGTLVNGFDHELSAPTVAVFVLNSVGRPLDVAYGASSVVLQPGGTWNFETSVVDRVGVGFEAYAMGGP